MPNKRALYSWCLYDWASSAFPTVIGTFVFATYFTEEVAENVELGTAQWGQAMSIAGVIIALTAPVIGAIADCGGRRKPWLATFSVLTILASLALWYVKPSPDHVAWAMFWVVVGTVGEETCMVFYNAMLPDLVPAERIGRVSGLGWGLGYIGGLVCLGIALLAFVQPEPPLFGLDKDSGEPVRAVSLLVGIWFAAFSWPIFRYTADRPSARLSMGFAVRRGLWRLIETLASMRRHSNVARYLFAQMIFIDGLNTLFAFGGIYAAGTIHFDMDEIILFGIGINIAGSIGCFAFGWIDDRIGPKKTILIALAAVTGLGGVLTLLDSKMLFWIFGLLLGVFIGPTQSASRSLMVRLSPPELMAEMFGLFALSGKASAFLGPMVLGWATYTYHSQRIGMATILVFLTAGWLLMLRVKEPSRARLL